MLIKRISFLILAVWFLLSIFSTSYNFVKGIRDISDSARLTTEEKRSRAYGGVFEHLMKVKNETPEKSTIQFSSDDPRLFYLANYFLYPRHILVEPLISGPFKKL